MNAKKPEAIARAKKPGTKKPKVWVPAFLASLAKWGVITAATDAAGITRRWVYEYRQRDPEFAAEWDLALERYADSLEQEASRRGRDGVLEPVYQGGARVGHVRKFDSQLLLALLRGARPEKYRERVDVLITVRESAKRVAIEQGLDVAEFVALAERIARGEEIPRETAAP